MLNKKNNFLVLFLLIPAILIFFKVSYGQEENNENTGINEKDTITFKTMKEELGKEGDWIKVKKEEIDSEDAVSEEDNYVDEDIDYENAWRPKYAILDPEWDPYSNGRWVYCDVGWVWVSDYSWGWAAYHYGRWWWSPIYGWVWSPGRRWAPCWVSWCSTPDYVGWYPISPRCRWHWHRGVIVTHPRWRRHREVHERWKFVNKSDFTKKIDKHLIVDPKLKKDLLKDAKMEYTGKQVYNRGPEKSDIENATGKKLTEKKTNFTDKTTKFANSKTDVNTDRNVNNTKRNDINKQDRKTNNNTEKRKVKTRSDNTGTNDKKKVEKRGETKTRYEKNNSKRNKDVYREDRKQREKSPERNYEKKSPPQRHGDGNRRSSNSGRNGKTESRTGKK